MVLCIIFWHGLFSSAFRNLPFSSGCNSFLFCFLVLYYCVVLQSFIKQLADFILQRGYISLTNEIVCTCGMKLGDHFGFSVAERFLRKRRYYFPERPRRCRGKGFWATGQCVKPRLPVSGCWLRHCCLPFPLCPVDGPQSCPWLTTYQRGTA